MTQVKFRVAAYTDAAGRFNPEAPRNGNEDNMFVNADLGAPDGSPFFESDKEMLLTDYGCLLVVADGMGGMNAGEVASEIAVNVVKGAFSKETIPHSAMEESVGREKYLKKVVVMADEAIKSHAKAHPECEGMGSTLVMAWLYGEEASIAWLGDSRIYLFREPEGLKQISKDHSYVQDLVDQGKITEEEAFIHPYNNIITRSLGDMSKKAEADSLTRKLFKGDILLLNSDGLSGVLHDEEMGHIIRSNRETMSSCRSALWKAAETAGWHDNVTAVLCEITEGKEYIFDPGYVIEDPDEKSGDKESGAECNVKQSSFDLSFSSLKKWLRIGCYIIGGLAMAGFIGLAVAFSFDKFGKSKRNDVRQDVQMDTVQKDTVIGDVSGSESNSKIITHQDNRKGTIPEKKPSENKNNNGVVPKGSESNLAPVDNASNGNVNSTEQKRDSLPTIEKDTMQNGTKVNNEASGEVNSTQPGVPGAVDKEVQQ